MLGAVGNLFFIAPNGGAWRSCGIWKTDAQLSTKVD